jgi:nucleotide-binding universal stress UspA family protein
VGVFRVVPRETEATTLRQFKIPVVLVVGGTEELIAAVSEAALSAQVLVAECTVVDVTDTAAQMRPLVMIIPEDVYQSDASNFEALARDVRAEILRVDADAPGTDLEADLARLMARAEAKRPSWTEELGGG